MLRGKEGSSFANPEPLSDPTPPVKLFDSKYANLRAEEPSGFNPVPDLVARMSWQGCQTFYNCLNPEIVGVVLKEEALAADELDVRYSRFQKVGEGGRGVKFDVEQFVEEWMEAGRGIVIEGKINI